MVPTSGMQLWLDARDTRTIAVVDGTVGAWRSKGALGDAVSAEGSRRPAYIPAHSGRRAVVRFDGRNDVLSDLQFGRLARTWTLVAVVAPQAGRGIFGGICSASPPLGNDYDPGFNVDLFSSCVRFDQLSVEGAGRIGGAQDQMTDAYPFGSMHVVVVERGDATIRLWIDGREQAARPVAPATTRMDELRIGARHYDGRDRGFFRGDVAQILLYDRTLPDPERIAIERILRVTDRERAMEQKVIAEEERNRMLAPTMVHDWTSVDAFLTEQRRTKRSPGSWEEAIALPIRTNVPQAIRLGMQCMNSMFDRDKDDEPYFFSNCREDGTGVMLHSVNIGIPHVVGRALWATMIGEKATRYPFPVDGLRTLERYCRKSFDNADHLNSYIDPARENRRFVEFHNMREGLYGLVALIEGREEPWARTTADQMLETLDSLTDEKGYWSEKLAEKRGMAGICEGMHPVNAGRLVDPLVAYYKHTRDPLALKLAGMYARNALEAAFEPDGRFKPLESSTGHIHSITSSLSGITAYAILTKNADMLAACRRAVDRGVPEYFSSWGWGDEVMPAHPANEIGRGEINQTGDVIRTALMLGESVDARYFDLAERFLRSMLLPTQHREPELREFMHDNPHPLDDSERDVIARTVGGYAMQLPNDRIQEGDWPLATVDITSGAVCAMSECLLHAVTAGDRTVKLNLLLDADSADVSVRSGLPFNGRIEFTMKSAKSFSFRIPPWVNRSTVKLELDGRPARMSREGAYVKTTALAAGANGVFTFAVPCKVEHETVDGTEYTTTWVGNQIIAISPRGMVSPLPF